MKKIGFLVGAAGISMLASQAMAVFVPPVGDIKFKLTDAANVYDPETLTARPRTPLGGPGIQEGDVDFTAFRLTSFTVGDSDEDQSIPGTLTGIVTFLEIDQLDSPVPGVVRAYIGDDESRPHTLAGEFDAVDGRFEDPLTGAPTIGRFYLYDNPVAGAGDFSILGGRPGDVVFGASDTLTNFTSGTLLATGSIVADTGDVPGQVEGTILDLLVASALPGVAATGSIGAHELLLDGGLWFDLGILDQNRASFQIIQVGYNGVGDPTVYPGHGDPNVFAGGWQLASEDPLQFRVSNPGIPEPITAGSMGLAVLALGGFATRRRVKA